MEYLITKNNNQYIKFDFANKITLTSNLNLAQRFTYNNAKSLVQNNIKPKDRGLYTIIEDTFSGQNPINSINTIFEECDFSWDNAIKLIQRVFSEAEVYKDKLQIMLDNICAEDNDIRHRIEFPKDNGNEFNAAEMVKLFKVQRDILRRRRNIKDEMVYLQILLESSIDDFKSGHVENRFSGIDSREYRVRAMPELFNGKEKVG